MLVRGEKRISGDGRLVRGSIFSGYRILPFTRNPFPPLTKRYEKLLRVRGIGVQRTPIPLYPGKVPGDFSPGKGYYPLRCTPIPLYPGGEKLLRETFLVSLVRERLFFGKRKDLYPYTPKGYG